jgi:hypothetical protein
MPESPRKVNFAFWFVMIEIDRIHLYGFNY